MDRGTVFRGVAKVTGDKHSQAHTIAIQYFGRLYETTWKDLILRGSPRAKEGVTDCWMASLTSED